MPNIEFGEWVTIDTATKQRTKRASATVTKRVEEPRKPHVSNACTMDMHTLCTGLAFNFSNKKFFECECTCGCEEARKGFAVQELINRNNAFDKWVEKYCNDEYDRSIAEMAFNAAWEIAKEYYNG